MKKRLGGILGILVMLFAMGMTVCAVDTGDITKNRVFQTIGDVNLYEKPDTASPVTASLPYGTPVIVQENAEDGWCMVAYREEAGYVQITFLGIMGSQGEPDAVDNHDMEANGAALDHGVVTDDGGKSEDGTVSATEVKPDEVDAADEVTASDDGAGANAETEPDDEIILSDAGTLDDEFQRVQAANLLAYQEVEAAKKQETAKRAWGAAIAVLVIAIFVVGITTTLAGNKRKKNQE